MARCCGACAPERGTRLSADGARAKLQADEADGDCELSQDAGSLRAMLQARLAASNPEAVRTIKTALASLENANVPRGLKTGEAAPDFTLPDATGALVSLSDRLKRGPVVLTFYRGAWCPYCNLTLAALQGALGQIKELGSSLMAISPQRPDEALTMREKHDLQFDVLSDVEQRVIKEYRVQFEVPPAMQDVQLNVFKKDVSQLNADGSWNLPIPATFVLDADGIVRAAHVDVDYTARMEPADIVRALRELTGEPPQT